MAKSRRKFGWSTLSKDELLNIRISDLGLRLKGTFVQKQIKHLYSELRNRKIRFFPHCWLSDEWFSPDYHPGIAIPFYLAHPRLIKMEEKFLCEAEGSSNEECIQILRHEAGHSIDWAFSLFKKKSYQKVFGNPQKRYPKVYYPNPKSRRYVLHLGFWYAQAHPVEDFAETFAVWLKKGSRWKRDYQGWPALKKLQYVDEIMQGIAEKKPIILKKDVKYEESPLGQNHLTLGEYFRKRRELYQIDYQWYFDKDLQKFFSNSPKHGRKRTAAGFLKKIHNRIRKDVAIRINEHPYVVDQILKEMIVRCKHLKLYVTRPEKQVNREAALFIAIQTFKYLNDGNPRMVI